MPILFEVIGIYSIQNGHWVKINNNTYQIDIYNTNAVNINFTSNVQYTNVYILIGYGFSIFVPVNSTV